MENNNALNKKWSDLDIIVLLVNITFFSIVYGIITNPIYVILTYKRIEHYDKSIVQCTKMIKKNIGYKGFYRGFGIACFGSLFQDSLFMSSLEYYKENGFTKLYSQAVNDFVSGFIAHSMVLPVNNFFSLISTKQMSAGLKHYNSHQNTFDTIATIYKQERLRGFFKGINISAIYIPTYAMWWSLYGFNKEIANKVSDNNLVISGTSAGLAGFTSTFFLNPVDVLYTKIQASNTKQKIMHMSKNIYKESGFRGFYRGLVLNVFEKTIESIVFGVTYDGIKNMSSF